MKVVDKTLLEVLIEEGFEWKSKYWFLAQDYNGRVYCYEKPPHKVGFVNIWRVTGDSCVTFATELDYLSVDYNKVVITKQQYLDAIKKKDYISSSEYLAGIVDGKYLDACAQLVGINRKIESDVDLRLRVNQVLPYNNNPTLEQKLSHLSDMKTKFEELSTDQIELMGRIEELEKVIGKELSSRGWDVATKGIDYTSSNIGVQPLTKEQIERGGWYCLDTSESVRLAFLGVGVDTEDFFTWSTKGYNSAVIYNKSGGCAYVCGSSLFEMVVDEGYKQIKLINGGFYYV